MHASMCLCVKYVHENMCMRLCAWGLTIPNQGSSLRHFCQKCAWEFCTVTLKISTSDKNMFYVIKGKFSTTISNKILIAPLATIQCCGPNFQWLATYCLGNYFLRLGIQHPNIISYTMRGSGIWHISVKSRVGCEFVETDICHIPWHPSGITDLSYDL